MSNLYRHIPKQSALQCWAFTLVELLIVIAIIATLAALLLSGLSRAKNAARLTQCRSNLRQIGLGMSMYASETGTYPYEGVWVESPPFGTFWAKALQKYTANDWSNEIYRCPSVRWFSRDNISLTGPPFPTGSYGYNAVGSGSLQAPNPLLGLGDFYFPNQATWIKRVVREEQVLVPSDMIALADTATFLYYLLPPWSVLTNHLESTMVHNPGVNVEFCDGHVSYMRLADYLAPTETARRRWNIDNQPHPETWR
jgi:prepilin-type N-terminal cleavage/methylation domain-containing protein/prepilin-type processing-associated H-X9-DG protein